MTKENAARAFEILSLNGKGMDITVRDDQNDFSAFLDGAQLCRKKGDRFRLIDTGKFPLFELEWLGKAGADLYTSDEARPKIVELDLLAKACAQGRAIVAYLHHGAIAGEGKESSTSLDFLKEVGRSGIYLHFSDRERERDFAELEALVQACREGGSWLVYYHHGRMAAGMEDLISQGAWVHLRDESLKSADDAALLVEIIRRKKGARANLVVHIEEGLELEIIRDCLAAGVHILFKTPPSDYKSAFRRIERLARKRKLDWRAYYLYTTLLP